MKFVLKEGLTINDVKGEYGFNYPWYDFGYNNITESEFEALEGELDHLTITAYSHDKDSEYRDEGMEDSLHIYLNTKNKKWYLHLYDEDVYEDEYQKAVYKLFRDGIFVIEEDSNE